MENTISSQAAGRLGTAHVKSRVVLVLASSIGMGLLDVWVKSGERQYGLAVLIGGKDRESVLTTAIQRDV